MKTIKNNVTYEYIIKKSKFICQIYRIDNMNNINHILNQLKIEYKNANHICFAYIINNLEKCSDDKEPSGTAGIPILNVLKQNNLNNILAIVIRYFGGIKLGASGLVRAYSKSVIEALKLTTTIELEEGYLIELEFDYNNLKLIDYVLNNKNIITKKYSNNIIYTFYLNKEELNFIPKLEKMAIHLSIKDKVLVEKN